MNILKLAFVFFFSFQAISADLLWVEMSPRFKYKDSYRTCSWESGLIYPFYMVAQIENDKVVYADFRNLNWPLPRKHVIFLEDEMKGIKVERDPLGDYRVKELPLSVRLFTWLLFNMDDKCMPSARLSTLDPYGETFSFQKLTATSYFSKQSRFQGLLDGGGEYDILLGFTQTMFLEPWGEM